MGKKNKVKESEQYEVWISTEEKGFLRVEEDGNGGVFVNKSRCLLLAQKKSAAPGVIETMVIERRLIASFNGEAIGEKHRLNNAVHSVKESPVAPLVEESKESDVNTEQKKESTDGEVHGDRPEVDDVQSGGAQHVGEAAPGGA